MPYLAVDKNGKCAIYDWKPVRGECQWLPYIIDVTKKQTSYMFVPKSMMLKLAGKTLTWDDEPFKITD